MRSRLFPTGWLLWLILPALLLLLHPLPAQASESKFEAELIWATDDAKPPPGKDYKLAEPGIRQKLSKAFKWKNYFLVNQKTFELPPNILQKVAVSEKCELQIKDLGSGKVEVALIGKGKEVMRREQVLPKGEILVLGGNSPNATGWMVTLKRLQ